MIYGNAHVFSTSAGTDYEERVAGLRDIVHSLPPVHYATLRRLLQHLDRLTDYEETNQMHAEGLAICIGPNVIRSPDAAAALAMMGSAVPVMKNLILLVRLRCVFCSLGI